LENLTKACQTALVLFFDIFRFIIFRNRRRQHKLCRRSTIDELVYFLECCYNNSNYCRHIFRTVPEILNFLQARG
jgi:hypothetical protein